MRFYALDSVAIDPLRADLMSRLEYHRDRLSRFEYILKKRFGEGAASLAGTGRMKALVLALDARRDLKATFIVDSLDDWLAELTRHGAKIIEGPTPGPISDAVRSDRSCSCGIWTVTFLNTFNRKMGSVSV